MDFALPAIQIVGSRIENWDIGFVDPVADNDSSAFFTLGPCVRKLDGLDLVNCSMRIEGRDGAVSEGRVAACYGSPLNATLWQRAYSVVPSARVRGHTCRSAPAGGLALSGRSSHKAVSDQQLSWSQFSKAVSPLRAPTGHSSMFMAASNALKQID